jgi:hypothetical protein
MAVATTPEKVVETDAQTRLRQAIADVERQLTHPSKSELSQAREDLDRRWTICSEELRRLAKPLTVRAPRVMGSTPVEPSPARIAQVQQVEHAAALLEHANQVRARANLALFQMR